MVEKVSEVTLLAIIRIRGTVDTPPKVKKTLELLNLRRKFTATIYPSDESIKGMLEVVKDWVTWGEIEEEVLRELILKRGRLSGGRRISEGLVSEVIGKEINELVKDLIRGNVAWHKLGPNIKPVFRLHPPKGGFRRSIKKPYNSGGELGYRGREINNLLRRMI